MSLVTLPRLPGSRRSQSWRAAEARALVVLPTYNEAENLRAITTSILQQNVPLELLIVDDQSPDGTGEIGEHMSRHDPRIHVLRRRGPRGLGVAYMAGFRWALRRGYDRIVQMDADFSHDPAMIPRLLAASEEYDLVVGSRYCPGGHTVGWPKRRQWLSFAANLYARTLLGSRIRDLTGGFKCWRREILEKIDFASLRADGYAFQFEMGHLAELAGARICEMPITFRERADGTSKMTGQIAKRAAWQALQLARDRLLRRPHPSLAPSRSGPEHRQTRRAAPKSVLVMCLGGIGDTVLSLAMLRQLRERLPEARLTALVMWPQAADLVQDLGVFEEIVQHNFQTDRGWKAMATLARLHLRRFDCSILAYPTNRWEFKLASWIVHARSRIGHRYENSGWFDNADFLLTEVVNQVPNHNVDENLRLLLRVPGCRSTPLKSADIRLGRLDSEYEDWADNYLAAIPGPYIGINAGCAEFKNMGAKRWPPERFAELCRLVSAELGLTPLLFGSPKERDLNWAIVRAAGVGQVVCDPSIRHAAAAIGRCAVFVANDSALGHLATAMNVPTVMIIGPTDPRMIRPYRMGVVATAATECGPCYRPNPEPLRCTSSHMSACLGKIGSEQVLHHVRRALRQGTRDSARRCPSGAARDVAPPAVQILEVRDQKPDGWGCIETRSAPTAGILAYK